MADVVAYGKNRVTGEPVPLTNADVLTDESGNSVSGGTATDSRLIEFTDDIGGIAAPQTVTSGTRTRSQRYPDGSTSGQFFEFDVPGNYVGGNLTIYMLCRTGAAVASPNNVVRLRTDGEVFDVSAKTVNAISQTDADISVADNTTGPAKVTIRQLTAGTFGAGDRIQFGFQRLGGHVNDLLGQYLDVLHFGYEYNA